MRYSAKEGKYNVHKKCTWVHTTYGLILLLEVKIIKRRRQISIREREREREEEEEEQQQQQQQLSRIICYSKHNDKMYIRTPFVEFYNWSRGINPNNNL